jgi:hypothetical protein
VKRRNFIALLGGAAAAWPLAARAQGPGRVYRLGVMVGQLRDSAMVAAFFDELRLLGFIEGQNLAIVAGGFGLRDEPRPALAAEIVKLAPDVIWNIGSRVGARALQELTKTIPIVTLGDDMVGEGLVPSLARPGGNITGISILSPELDSKRQDILIDAVPGVRRLAALADSKVSTPSNSLCCKRPPARAASTSPFIPLGHPRISYPRWIRRRLRALQRSTCWRRRYLPPSTGASYWAALRPCGCPPSTNGLRWLRRAASPPMARA